MVFTRCRAVLALLFLLTGFARQIHAAETLRIATYNVENYLDHPSGTRPAKSAAAKAKVCEGILALKPDVLALQEIGGTNVLLELQSSLKSAGLDLPHWEYVEAFDTNIHLAVLSRFPFAARHPHTNDSFLLGSRAFRVKRGFAQVEIQAAPDFTFTLIVAHLKSKVPTPEADEADLRLSEAKILREKIDACLNANPNANLIVLGDLNDTHDSPPIKAVLGRGKKALVDTRPSERNGDALPHSDRRLAPRSVSWTHFYAKQDLYSRVDYILLSHAMARHLDPAETRVLALPDWGLASDHRPLVAVFTLGHSPAAPIQENGGNTP
jgi:endonuclease/exonuclease/phosphatase family metal-dependent hydrolase